MKTIKSRYVQIILLVLIVIAGFQNCSPNVHFKFEPSLQKVVKNLESREIGTGGGYLGKPQEGDYTRTYPDYKCNSSSSDQGHLTVTNFVHIAKDNCQETNINFDFTDSVLDFSPHNPDYLGVGTAIYEIKKPNSTELPVTEVWCKFTSEKKKFDIAVKVDSKLQNAKAKVFLDLDGNYRVTSPVAVTRTSDNSELIFNSESLTLQVQKLTANNHFANGHAQMMLDNVLHEQDVTCRVASVAPIEDMNTSLTKMFPLNAFTTDKQESICAHSSILSCENAEDRTSEADLSRAKFAQQGWHFGGTGSYVISPIAYDGSKSIEIFYPANSSSTDNNGIRFTPASEIYFRFYIKWSANFMFSAANTGIASLVQNLWLKLQLDGAKNLEVSLGTTYYSAPFQPTVNQWYCLETRYKSASNSTSSDGALQVWINESPAIDVKNHSTVELFNEWGNLGSWTCTDANNDSVCDTATHPAQSVYLDNIVIAKQRVGCF